MSISSGSAEGKRLWNFGFLIKSQLEKSPSVHTQRPYDDHWSLVYGHRAILPVLPTKETYGSSVFLAGKEYSGSSCYENVSQSPPVLDPSIDHQRHLRIFVDVPQPFKLMRRNSLGLFVNR
jgi:hypothetical protein